MNIPSITAFANVIRNEEDAIQMLVDNDVIKAVEDEYCIELDCGGRMGLKDRNRSFRQLKCNSCRSCRSRFAGTFFDGAKIEIHMILYLAIFWLCKMSVGQVMTYVKKMSNETVTNYYGHFRQLVANMIDETKLVLGGEGVEVEIDESKFAKRKYHRGHRVGTKDWVFGGIEKLLRPGEIKKRYFAVIVEDRTRLTLEPIIRKYIAPGSSISSDFWKAYDWIGEKDSGYTHNKVSPLS